MKTNSDEYNMEEKILYKELSYKLQGLFFDIRNELGSGHKESIYQKALEKELINTGINFKKEAPIKIFSSKKEFLGLYRPDFLVEDKIIIELKASTFVTKQESARVYDYLRNSEYELAYLVNFASPKLYIRRFLFTNDRKEQNNFSRKMANLLLFVFITFVAIRALPIRAATLSFNLDQAEINQGSAQDICVMLKLEGDENINAVEGRVKIQGEADVLDVNVADSIISLWIETPKYDFKNQEIKFSGIIPGGFRGRLTPRGLESDENKVFCLNLRAIGEAGVKINLNFVQNETRALLNDGLGTEAKLVLPNSALEITGAAVAQKILSSPTHPVDNKWYKESTAKISWPVRDGAVYSYMLSKNNSAVVDEIPEDTIGNVEYRNLEDGIWYFLLKEKEKDKNWKETQSFKIMIDTVLPEPIFASLQKNKDMFDGRYFIVFNAADKGSGIDHFELWEGMDRYVDANSPFVLKDQTLGREIVVWAVDKAGNTREIRALVPGAALNYEYFLKKYGLYGLAIFLIAAFLIFVYNNKSKFLRSDYARRK